MKKRKLDPRVQRKLKESWEKMLAKYPSKNVTAKALPLQPIFRRETPYVPSATVTVVEVAAKKDSQMYTGTKMLGVGTMHKSNSVPIFSEQEAIDISTMRRS